MGHRGNAENRETRADVARVRAKGTRAALGIAAAGAQIPADINGFTSARETVRFHIIFKCCTGAGGSRKIANLKFGRWRLSFWRFMVTRNLLAEPLFCVSRFYISRGFEACGSFALITLD